MLDIIITHYREPWEVGRKLFQMIGLQRGVDFSRFRVTVINDGGHRLPEEELARLSYKVEQIDIEHGGISKARNTGIDRSEAPFIMFCDFDDTFTNIYALRDLMSVLPCDYDMLWSHLLVEDTTNGQDRIYETPERQRFVFVHGKIYRRQFLIDQGIRFNEEMSFQEDSLFNATITARTDFRRIGEIRAPIVPYVWVRRQNSVTQSGRDDEAAYWHFRRNLEVTAEQDTDEKRAGMITRTAYDAYFMAVGRRCSPEMKKKIVAEFRPWIIPRKKEFCMVPDDILAQLIDVSRYELLEADEQVPDEPKYILDWINEIIREGEDSGNLHNEH